MFSSTPLLGNKENEESKNGKVSGIELTPFGQQNTDPFSDKFFTNKYRWRSYRETKCVVFNFLEDPRDCVSRTYHSFVVMCILVTLGLAISLSVRGLEVRKAEIMRISLSGMEGFLAFTFLLEYLLRLWSCSAKGTYAGCSGLLRYMVKPHMILDLVVIFASLVLTSVTLGMGKSWDDIRYLMPLQLLRILRIDRQRGAFKTFHTVITKHFKELLTCWYMGFIVIMFLSYLVYAESSISGDNQYTADDLANSLYWGIVSMTTIGYGDILPKTGISKLILCIFALVGTGFIALPAGIIGSGFALQVIELKKQKQVRKRRRPAAILLQSFWKVWAADIAKSLEATWIPHVTIIREVKEGELPPLFTCAAGTFQKLPGTNLRYKPVNKPGTTGRDGTACGYVVYKELSKAEKLALGFIRHLKFIVALKGFRQTKRPLDEKDIMDQFTGGQVEISEQLKQMDKRMELIQDSREFLEERFLKMEIEMKRLRNKNEEAIQILGRLELHLFGSTKVENEEQNALELI